MSDTVTERVGSALKLTEEMTALELASYAKALREKFGVTAAPMAMAGGGGGGGGGAAAAVEEKTNFDVVLTDSGANKIAVIKEIRALTNLGLKEAKDFVEAPGKPIKTGIKKEEADEIKKKVEAAGAKVEIR